MMKVDMIMILEMMMIFGKGKNSKEKGFDNHAHDNRYHEELHHLDASIKLKELEIQEWRDDDHDYCHHPHSCHLDAAMELKELESLE